MASLQSSLENWYAQDPTRVERYRAIIEGRAGFSLREIDHFVTHMTARRPVVFYNRETGRIVDVNADYKDVLRCYHKLGLDPFNRTGGQQFKQLNFFRWAMENGIVDYVSAHSREIAQDMLDTRKGGRVDRRQMSYFAIVRQPKEILHPYSRVLVDGGHCVGGKEVVMV